jgi:hypothetical protein
LVSSSTPFFWRLRRLRRRRRLVCLIKFKQGIFRVFFVI